MNPESGSAPSTPPPIPQRLSRPRPPAPASKSNTWIIWVVLAGAAVFGLIGIGTAILIPTVSKVRETARRTVDASNLRQIGSASLIHAGDNAGRLPGWNIAPDGSRTEAPVPATIHRVAAVLARDGVLNDASLWFATQDRGSPQSADAASKIGLIVLDDGTVNPAFMRQDCFAWDYVTGLNTNMSSLTPVAWTRGLRRDGTWDAQGGVYGDDGGHIVFLGGNVQFFADLSRAPLMTPGGQRTTDILKALPAGTRVVGAGPGTLHGAEGGGR